MKTPYEIIIGLEIHLQLATESKLFCSCVNRTGDQAPNANVCPVCMGHAGTLPVLNQQAVRQGMRLALALNASIASDTRFDRKNYFYPDLPKGYQISQYDHPLATGGYLKVLIEGRECSYRLERLHLEEDAAKNIHRGRDSLVDFNRAGIPLLEIVTRPDLRSPEHARAFLQELRLVARYTGASDADMEKGQMRCDANISLRPYGDTRLGAKIEIKNLNSFRSVERALAHEVRRQTELWNAGTPPEQQETRGWDEVRGVTRVQRTKEGSDDYRYFPEPDLRPLRITQEDIQKVRRSLPELPWAKRARFSDEYGLTLADSSLLVADRDAAAYYENVVAELSNWLFDTNEQQNVSKDELWERHRSKLTRSAFAWLTTELFKLQNADNRSMSECRITPENMAEFIIMLYESKINSTAAQIILKKMYDTGKDPHDIAEEENLFQTSDEQSLQEVIRSVIAEYPDQVQHFRAGKEPVLQFLIGKVMKESGGRANPTVVAELLRKMLS